jgi:diguanylate cyclase (GGDEF)-like protein
LPRLLEISGDLRIPVVQHLAEHDALTGVANRTLLMSQIKQTLARAQRSGRSVAVLFIDLNHFKQVNDVLGHDAGDKLLQIVAERLRNFVRAGEIVARLGGDEFIVVLEDLSDEDHPGKIMQRLLSRLHEPAEIMGTPISASAGLAIFPADGDNPESLIKIADMKMYVASMTPVPGVRLATRLPPQTYYPKTILGLLNSLGTTLLCP